MSVGNDPIEAWLPGNDGWSNMLFMATSYAEAAEVLCKALQEGDFAEQYTSAMVIRQLCRHAIELFLKGAIGMKGEAVPLTHRLDRLYREYVRLYPHDKFHFTMPVSKQILSSEDMFLDDLEKYQREDSERHRYPVSRNGTWLSQLEEFDTDKELRLIDNLRSAINVLGFQIAERFENVTPPGKMF